MSCYGKRPKPELFRFSVSNGGSFQLQIPGNPGVQHDGGLSVFPLVLTEDEAGQVVDTIESFGCTVRLYPPDRQTSEQEKERHTLLGMGKEDVVWPSAACPECAWFDPLLAHEPCGRLGWPPEAIKAFLSNPKPQQDSAACPVPHLWRTSDG